MNSAPICCLCIQPLRGGFANSAVRLSCLYLCFSSRVINKYLRFFSPFFIALKMLSNGMSIIGICYLFLCIVFIKIFDSSAFFYLSMLTVIATGKLKYASEQLCSYPICTSAIKFDSSRLTRNFEVEIL